MTILSGTGRPINFVLIDSRVEFSGTADRMELFPVAPKLCHLLLDNSRYSG